MASANFDAARFLEGLREAARRVIESQREAASRAAKKTLDRAKELVPVKTGRLRDTGNVEVAGDTKEVVALVAFTADYAAAVHENLQAHHDQGQAKFLEAAMREEAPALGEAASESARRALG